MDFSKRSVSNTVSLCLWTQWDKEQGMGSSKRKQQEMEFSKLFVNVKFKTVT